MVWEQIPYDEHVEAVEDKLWTSLVLSKGLKIRSCAEAMFIYTRKRRKIDQWRAENMRYKALYRTTGHVPLGVGDFVVRVVKAAILTPVVGLRYFIDRLVSSAYLVIVPWQAKYPPRAGSVAEYDKPSAS